MIGRWSEPSNRATARGKHCGPWTIWECSIQPAVDEVIVAGSTPWERVSRVSEIIEVALRHESSEVPERSFCSCRASCFSELSKISLKFPVKNHSASRDVARSVSWFQIYLVSKTGLNLLHLDYEAGQECETRSSSNSSSWERRCQDSSSPWGIKYSGQCFAASPLSAGLLWNSPNHNNSSGFSGLRKIRLPLWNWWDDVTSWMKVDSPLDEGCFSDALWRDLSQ